MLMLQILFYLITLQTIYYTVKTAVINVIKDINIDITYGPQQNKTTDELD